MTKLDDLEKAANQALTEFQRAVELLKNESQNHLEAAQELKREATKQGEEGDA